MHFFLLLLLSGEKIWSPIFLFFPTFLKLFFAQPLSKGFA
jgi:hypothetical protein